MRDPDDKESDTRIGGVPEEMALFELILSVRADLAAAVEDGDRPKAHHLEHELSILSWDFHFTYGYYPL